MDRFSKSSVQFFTETYFPGEEVNDRRSIQPGNKTWSGGDKPDSGDASVSEGKDALIIEIERDIEPAVTILTPAAKISFDDPNGEDSILYYPESADKNSFITPFSGSRDDGVYVPPAPKGLNDGNLARMTTRLIQGLKPDQESWTEPTDVAGVGWRDPFLKRRTKPAKKQLGNYNPVAVYSAPVPFNPSPSGNLSVAPKTTIESQRLLHLSVFGVRLTRHPRLRSGQSATRVLRDAYDVYRKRCVEEQLADKWKQKLNEARKSRQLILNSVCNENDENGGRKQISDQGQGEGEKPNISVSSRLSRSDLEIEQTKRQWLQAAESERKALRDTIKAWKVVRDIRKQNGPVEDGESNIKLVITRLDVPANQHEEILAKESHVWEDEIDTEIREKQRYLRRQYHEATRRYKEQLRRYKSDGSKTKCPTKPNAPDLSYEAIYGEIAEKLEASLRPPGEPKVKLDLVQVDKLQGEEAPVYQLTVRVLLDGVEACRTQASKLCDVMATFNEKFSIAVIRVPQTLSFEITESQTRSKSRRRLGLLHVAPPEADVDYKRAPKQEFCFASTGDKQHDGSDVVSGIITISTGWDNPVELQIKPHQIADMKGHHSRLAPLLRSWLRQGMLDPNEPQYCDMLNKEELKRSFDGEESILPSRSTLGRGVFRLDSEGIWFTGKIKCSKVIEIRTRMRADLALKSTDKVPADAIHSWDRKRHAGRRYLRKAYQAHLAAALLLQQSCIGGEMGGANERNITRGVTTASLIHLPEASGIVRGIAGLLRARRPLRPDRLDESQSVLSTNVQVQSAPVVYTSGLSYVSVYILRAVNVPKREADEPEASPKKNSAALSSELSPSHGQSRGDSPGRADESVSSTRKQSQGVSRTRSLEVNVRPFVVVSYRGRALRTDTASGCEPAWNQELRLPLPDEAYFDENIGTERGRMKSDEYPSRGSLRLQLYDERVQTISVGVDDRGDEVHQRITRHFLAGAALPIHSLRQSGGRLDGALELRRPRLLLGYEEPAGETRLAVCITIEHDGRKPSSPPMLEEPCGVCAEPPAMARHLAAWRARLWAGGADSSAAARHLVTLVTLLGGRTVCITRLLTPLKPPPPVRPDTDEEPLDLAIRMRAAARFVSMIPIHENDSKGDTVYYNGIWLTADKLLHLLHGSARDLAVLLCCYFLGLQVRAWLVLGRVLARGDSALVLTHEIDPEGWYLWDPSTGERNKTTDPLCSLQVVYCVIGQDNIWANIQRETRAHMTRWDMPNRSRDWKPCFLSGPINNEDTERWCGPAPKESVQPSCDMNLYVEIRTQPWPESGDLEIRIHTRLVQRIEKWRSHRSTIWNRFGNESLARILPNLEADVVQQLDSQRHVTKMRPLLTSYKVTGFPINIPYTSLSALTETVRATGTHLNDNPKAEFSLAVYVQAYPCHIASVWIFIAALVPRK